MFPLGSKASYPSSFLIKKIIKINPRKKKKKKGKRKSIYTHLHEGETELNRKKMMKDEITSNDLWTTKKKGLIAITPILQQNKLFLFSFWFKLSIKKWVFPLLVLVFKCEWQKKTNRKKRGSVFHLGLTDEPYLSDSQ